MFDVQIVRRILQSFHFNNIGKLCRCNPDLMQRLHQETAEYPSLSISSLKQLRYTAVFGLISIVSSAFQ